MSKRKQGDSPTVGLPVHNIEFSIEVNLRSLSFDNYMKIKEVFEGQIIDDKWDKTIDFKKLVDILRLENRKYRGKSIEYPKMDRNDEFEQKMTKIEIVG